MFDREYEFGRVAVDELGRVSERGRVLDDVLRIVLFPLSTDLLDDIVLLALSTGLLYSLDVLILALPFDL